MHGGGPDVVAGKPLDFVYKEEALDLVKVLYAQEVFIYQCIYLVTWYFDFPGWLCKPDASYQEYPQVRRVSSGRYQQVI